MKAFIVFLLTLVLTATAADAANKREPLIIECARPVDMFFVTHELKHGTYQSFVEVVATLYAKRRKFGTSVGCHIVTVKGKLSTLTLITRHLNSKTPTHELIYVYEYNAPAGTSTLLTSNIPLQ